MLLDKDGTPAPPQAALAMLKTKSSRLGLKMFPSMAGAYFGVTEEWKWDDPRRVRIQQGEIPPGSDFDLIHSFPPDMRAEDCAAWVQERYGDRILDTAEAEAESLRRSIELDRRNIAKKEARLEAFEQQNERKVLDDTAHQRRVAAGIETAHPMVAGFGDTPKRSTDKAPKIVIADK